MKVIVSHVNLDFDGLASIVAASKLYPDAQIVLSDKQNAAVRQFLAIYRDKVKAIPTNRLNWDEVDHLIIVDVASKNRLGGVPEEFSLENVQCTIIDHHPIKESDIACKDKTVELLGATVTLLVEEIERQSLPITSFEATLFGLGIYTDTGSFTYPSSTPRDVRAVAYLMEQGMNSAIINRFSEQLLLGGQKQLFQALITHSTERVIDGLQIIVSIYKQDNYEGGLSTLARKLLEMTHSDATILVVEMQKKVYIVGRASSERINLLPLIHYFKGGGHEKAASAMIKKRRLEEVSAELNNYIHHIIKPALTAKQMMSSPVKMIPSSTSIDEASEMMYRYGHSGLPVLDNDQLVGIISRRDIDKAAHHGLGHAPVKAYMSQSPICITSNTSLEEVQALMIRHNIGRLPVLHNNTVVGIVSRTNVIEALHQPTKENHIDMTLLMQQSFPETLIDLLGEIGQCAHRFGNKAYLIGGVVRDLLLERKTEDIDIVIDGDGILFAEYLQRRFGGVLKTHETFKTATWTTPDALKIDIVTSRTEYYDYPAALPSVAHSNLKEDLFRRDFTINAMALALDPTNYGTLIDPYYGREDIKNGTIRIMHNLSFVEDPTRILRAVRFEQRFKFKMSKETLSLAKEAIHHISSLSAVRISHECKKLFEEARSVKPVLRLGELGFWKQLHPKANNHLESLKEKTNKLETLLKTVQLNRHWYLYMILPFYKLDNWVTTVSPYALSPKDTQLIAEIDRFPSLDSWDMANLHRSLHKISNEAIIFILAAQREEIDEQALISYLIKRKEIPPLLSGEDLIKLGFNPGPAFSDMLFTMEVAYLNGEIRTKQDAYAFTVQKYK